MLTWQRPDIFKTKLNQVDFHKVELLRRERFKKMERPHFSRQAEAIGQLPTADQLPNPIERQLNLNHVTIGRRLDLTEHQHDLLEKAIYQLLPWRKGPFRLFDHEIDSEWQSYMKWDRIAAELGCLEGKQILDVGCGNGYYMFRAAQQKPRLILGIDPSIPFYLQFELMQRYLHLPNLQYELMGVGISTCLIAILTWSGAWGSCTTTAAQSRSCGACTARYASVEHWWSKAKPFREPTPLRFFRRKDTPRPAMSILFPPPSAW